MRRHGRLAAVADQLYGQIVTYNVPLTLRELSASGFSIESPLSFPRGAKQLFRFITADGQQVMSEATVVYSRSGGNTQDQPGYVTGFSFVQDSLGKTATKIEILLDAVLGSLDLDEDAPSSAVEPTRHAG